MKHILTSLALALVVVSVSTTAVAQQAKSQKQAEAAVKYRQSLFQLLKSNLGPLGGMAKGAIPFDTKVMATNATRIQQLADMTPDYFVVNTSDFPVSTDAEDSIWENSADFTDKAAALKAAADDLSKVVKSGDESAYRDAISAISKTCKACHKKYKQD